MDIYKNFYTIAHSRIEELDCSFQELVHRPTGAHIIHIANEDPENLFCLSFRTLPESSSGVAHILEHTVLCGSKKFPVKDPFFAMTRRSLNTFMNAFTGADFTCYPAASQVKKDFYNLLDVYVDAVFHPYLHKSSFYQEGCRLEFQDSQDLSSPLEYKGIVYNEMKGSLSSPDSRLWHAVLEGLFPNLPYQYNSGGEPKEIPNLSYEQLLDFHKTNYHPSRCLFFFYGNFPLKNHLDYLETHVFTGISPLPPTEPLPKQPRFSTPISRRIPYPVREEEDLTKKVIVAFSWLTCALIDQEETLALALLDSILTDTDASPLKQALLESGLCTQVSAFIDTEMSEVPYVLTCRGCKESDIGSLEEILFNTLRSLSEKPLPKQWIEASLHQLEFSRMEITGDSSPFGLTLFFRSALTKQHGCDPLQTLQLHQLFTILLDKVKDPLYLPGLIRKYFVDNQHHIKVVMVPDPQLGSQEIMQEKQALQKLKESLSESQVKEILQTAQELEEIQASVEEQDLSCLPKVTLGDVPILTREFPLEIVKSTPLTFFHHEAFTNHILYTSLAFDLPCLEEEEIPYLHLLLSLLPDLGSGKRNFRDNLEYIHSYTGGISLGVSLYNCVQDSSILQPALSIKGKALERNIDKLFPLIQDTLIQPHLQNAKRIKDLIEQIHTSLQSRLAKSSLHYAIQLAQSSFSQAHHFNHLCFGIPYYHFIGDIVKDLPKTIPLVIEKLTSLHKKLFTFYNPVCITACDGPLFTKMQDSLLMQLSLPTASQKTPFSWPTSTLFTPPPSQGKIIPAQVAYNVCAYKTCAYIHPHSSALQVATQLLDNKILHNRVREIGGAYGVGATYTAANGSFYFYSYRDPHIENTFRAFDEAMEAIGSGQFSLQDLEEAKLGLLQHMDAPLTPVSRSLSAYGWLRTGKTVILRQEHRDKVLGLEPKDITLAVRAELLEQKNEGIAVCFGSKELLEKQSKLPIYPL